MAVAVPAPRGSGSGAVLAQLRRDDEVVAHVAPNALPLAGRLAETAHGSKTTRTEGEERQP
ncbi:hypothetical protein [Streptomyces sp. NPDC059176]|uniref:hypothetical protein n=1 Tax=unclassified Streptomyces TaxID=2593676 RepID=UPI0036958708